MRRTLSLAVLALLGVTARAEGPAAKPPSTEDALVAQVAEAKWVAPKVPGIPAGALASPIAVEPTSGASIGYAKFPPGYSFPLHWHSATEYTVLIAGKATFTIAGKAHEMVPGSYVVIPPKMQHKLDCAAGSECLLMTRRAGPTDYNWVK